MKQRKKKNQKPSKEINDENIKKIVKLKKPKIDDKKIKQVSEFEKEEILDINSIAALIDKKRKSS